MREHISKLLLLVMVLLPLGLFLGASLFGRATPVTERAVSQANFLNSSPNKVEVIFFGYVGCAFICPTSLHTLGEVMDEIRDENPDASLGAYFIDVNAETQVQRAHQYSQFFSKEIVGINVSQEELNELKKMFGITVVDTNRSMDEIIHTDHFYIVRRDTDNWRIAKVLSNESNQTTIKSSIIQVLADQEPEVMLANF